MAGSTVVSTIAGGKGSKPKGKPRFFTQPETTAVEVNLQEPGDYYVTIRDKEGRVISNLLPENKPHETASQ